MRASFGWEEDLRKPTELWSLSPGSEDGESEDLEESGKNPNPDEKDKEKKRRKKHIRKGSCDILV